MSDERYMTLLPPLLTPRVFPRIAPESASLAEERREVFESVLAALALDPLDADRIAASSRLLRHLSTTAALRPA